MEEQVGQLWHRLITRAAATEHRRAAVRLEDVRKTVGVLFRALGGDGGLRIEAATATDYAARRTWLQRIAGSHRQVELAWRDAETLRLPEQLAVFAEPGLNRDLYLWLAALAATPASGEADWFRRNQAATRATLERFPGLLPRYRRLADALLALRPATAGLPPAEAAQELALRAALRDPGSVAELPPAPRPPQPLYLWLHPAPPGLGDPGPARPDAPEAESGAAPPRRADAQGKRRRAKRAETPDGKRGLLAFRLESLFSRAEYVKVDRTTDEEQDLEKARDALEDMEQLSVAQDAAQTAAVALRFDLDLPSPQQDDTVLEGESLLPEWDYKRRVLRPDYCRLLNLVAEDAAPAPLPPRLRRLARRLRRQFEGLAPLRVWHKNQAEGSEVDLEAYLDHAVNLELGLAQAEGGLYRDFRGGDRDLACLLLADLSLSTDAWVNNQGRVIDVVRDSLYLFAEALSASGDRFALYGFSSRRRDHVRFQHIKSFTQRYNDAVRGRIEALRPGYYTRMGAAIRHAANLLALQPARQRLLLLLTDGKPNDLDHYEGRYGVEDTREAVREARKRGLQVFCVTIDEQAGEYLPHLFGGNGYVFIRNPAQLPKELPKLYLRLTQSGE